ncbi:MAG: ComF family protein [Syntrophobacterales bacterium]|nr:MAG: ComF family protein [Syntrophobacterales bacterium]
MMICEVKELVSGFADMLFPEQCPTCGTALFGGGDFFCSDCLSTVRFTTPPQCTSCGIPFTTTQGADHLCEECILSTPPFSVARSLGLYEGALLDAIHLFKYHGKISVGEDLGRMMAQASYASLAIGDYSLIIPVPLHPKRLRERGFNQSLVLARQVSKRCSIPLDFLALRRTLHTEAQVRLSGRQRRINVRGAFEVTDRNRVEGKKIVLIDDVYTTGSTVAECSKVLMKSGAKEVAVLTLARA